MFCFVFMYTRLVRGVNKRNLHMRFRSPFHGRNTNFPRVSIFQTDAEDRVLTELKFPGARAWIEQIKCSFFFFLSYPTRAHEIIAKCLLFSGFEPFKGNLSLWQQNDVRDWSKSIGWGGLGRLELWWIKNTWPTPSFWHKTDWPNP